MGKMSRSILAIFLLSFACLAHALTSAEHIQSSPCPSSPAQSQYEQDVVSHLVARLKDCIGQSPPNHGMLVQIQDLSNEDKDRNGSESSEDATAADEDEDDSELEKRRFYESIAKGWDSMPFDQRLSVMSTAISVVTMPLYLMNSGVSFDEYEIGNVKDRLVAQASGNKTHLHAPFVLPPPPSMVAPTTTSSKHAKRSFIERLQGLTKLVKRNPPKPEGHEKEMPEPTPAENEAKADDKNSKKESNATVSRLCSIFGAANALLYIPVSLLTAVRTVLVRDSDTATYKRSLAEDHMKGFTVICHPVQKVGEQDYQIPLRSPLYKTHFKRAVLPIHPIEEEEEKVAIEVKKGETVEAEKVNETLENIHRNETLSEMESEQKEQNLITQDQDISLQRRAPQHEVPKGSGGGAHGPEGGPPGGPGGSQPPFSGPIREESIKHVYMVDDRSLRSAKNPNPGGMSKMQMGMAAVGGAVAGYGVLSMYQAAQAPAPNAQGQQMSPQYAQMMAQQLAQQRMAAQYGQRYPQMASRGGGAATAASKASPYYDDYDSYYDDGDDYGDLDDDIYAAALAAALEKKAAAAKGAVAKTTSTTSSAAAVAPASPAVVAAEVPAAVVMSPAPVTAPVTPVVTAPAPATEAPMIQTAPIVAANGNSTSAAPTRRSVYADLSGEMLFKRNPPPEKRPGGPELDPFLVKTQFEIQHHNTPPEHIPGYELGYGKKREPAGPPGSPEQLAQEEQERKEEEALAKGQKTPWGKVAAIGVGGAIVGALYKTFWGTPAPQPAAIQQGYYGDQDGYYYRKRELNKSAFVKRSPETYDEIVRSLKDEVAREEKRRRSRKMDRIEYDSDANGQHFAVNKSKSTPLLSYYSDEDDEETEDNDEYLYRRDNSDLQYDADATGQHFSVIQRDSTKGQESPVKAEKDVFDDDEEDLRRRGDPSIEYNRDGDNQHFAVYQNQGDEESWQRRDDSSIVYDDTGDAQHFSAIIPEASSVSLDEEDSIADDNVETLDDIEKCDKEMDLKRREDSKIEYDADAYKQHFRVKKGDIDEEETVLERRRDASISLDSDSSGSHFRATLPSTSANHDDEEIIQRRDQDDTIDYHTGKNNDVTFTAHAHLEPKVEVDDAIEDEDEDEYDEDEDEEIEEIDGDEYIESNEEECCDDEEMQRRGEANISLDTNKDGSSHFEAIIPADAEDNEEDEEIDLSRREEADISYHSDEENGTDFHASTKHLQKKKKEDEKCVDINTRYGRNGVVTIEIAPQDDCESQESTCKRPCYTPDR